MSHSLLRSRNRPDMRELSNDGASEPDLIPFPIPIDHVFNAIKDQPWVRHSAYRRTRNDHDLESTAPSTTRWVTPPLSAEPSGDTSKTWLIRDISESSSSTRDCLRRLRYKGSPHETSRPAASHPVSGGECNLRHLPNKGATTKERAIYVNEARRDNYPVILTNHLRHRADSFISQRPNPTPYTFRTITLWS